MAERAPTSDLPFTSEPWPATEAPWPNASWLSPWAFGGDEAEHGHAAEGDPDPDLTVRH
jgi:hypothetical protein